VTFERLGHLLSNPSVRWIGGLVVAILFVATLTWRGFLTSPPESSAAIYARQGAAAFATLRVAAVTDRESVYSIFGNAPLQRGSAALGTSERAALESYLSEFVSAWSGTSDDYLRWREDQGDTIRSAEQVFGHTGAEPAYRWLTENPLPPLESDAELFKAMFEAAREYGDGANRPEAIALDVAGVLIHVETIAKWPAKLAMLSGELPAEVWHGGRARGGRSWWSPARTIDELLAMMEVAIVARVGIVFEFANGTRRPLQLTLFFDPGDMRWHLENIASMNFWDEPVAPLEY
jgi:hypothetical protein